MRRRRPTAGPTIVLLSACLLALVPGGRARAEPTDPATAPPLASDCPGDIARVARAGGVPEAVANRLMALEPDPAVVAATQSQAEFIKPIWAYLDANLTEARIEAGPIYIQLPFYQEVDL